MYKPTLIYTKNLLTTMVHASFGEVSEPTQDAVITRWILALSHVLGDLISEIRVDGADTTEQLHIKGATEDERQSITTAIDDLAGSWWSPETRTCLARDSQGLCERKDIEIICGEPVDLDATETEGEDPLGWGFTAPGLWYSVPTGTLFVPLYEADAPPKPGVTYTVREPGCSSWESGLETLAEAQMSKEQAIQEGLRRTIIVRETITPCGRTELEEVS